VHLLSKLVLSLMVALFASSIYAQAPRLTFEEYVKQRMQQHGVAGVSIATIENGHLTRTLTLGLESTATASPVSRSSVFQVGSISKPVAAWVVMTLVRDGKLELDQPVSKYLSRWSIPESIFDADEITLRRLLSHTAGLRLHGYSGFAESTALPSLEESLSGITHGAGKVALFQPPGVGFSYSGGGYTLIQLLVEEVSGLSFSDYASASVLAPLGMNDSSYTPDEELLKRRVAPHGYSLNPITQRHFRAQAAASLHTTASDLARFVLANLSANSLLERDSVAMMHSPVADAGFAKVGLGFFTAGNGELVGHGGANLGWRAEMQFNPKTGDGLVIMTNSDGASRFLSDVKCFWSVERSISSLSKECSDAAARLAKSAALMNRVTLAIAMLTGAIFVALLWALATARLKLSLPSSRLQRMGLFALVSITLFIMAFLYTSLGAYLLTGFNSVFATIHYAPPEQAKVAPWVCGLLLMLWLPFFFTRTKPKKRA